MEPIIRPTITQTFLERVRSTPYSLAFQFKPTYSEMGQVGQWAQMSYQKFFKECKLISFGLSHLGVKPGEKVAILANTRIEWSLCDMAVLGARGVTIPIYASNTIEEAAFIIDHSEAKVIIVENTAQLEKVLQKKSSLPLLQKIIAIEPSAMSLRAKYSDIFGDVLTLQAVKELGRRTEQEDPAKFERDLASANPKDLITICYTSGTTGVPKGVMLTHENIMSTLEDCAAIFHKSLDFRKEVALTFLPFSHIFGKIESMAVYAFGWKQVFAESLEKIMVNMAEIHPTLIFAVPRVFEKTYSRIHGMVETFPKIQKEIFHRAVNAGNRFYEAVSAGKRPGIIDTVEYQAAKALVFRGVIQKFGGKLKYAVCGGAPLAKEIAEFLNVVGIQILEGYGLTETSAPVCLNAPGQAKFGSVGRPLPEVSIKIAEDGEILVKSRKLFSGYYKMPKETKEALVDGWFHTGDIGHFDEDGFLYITDRKKDLIITSGGKNIAPQKIENLAKSHKLINQLMVHGDRRPYLTALVTLDNEKIVQYANSNHILFSEYSELIRHPKIIALAQRTIDDVNKQLAKYETIKKFMILPQEFTIEGGELTPSLKVRRSFVNRKFKSELDRLYEDGAGQGRLDSVRVIR